MDDRTSSTRYNKIKYIKSYKEQGIVKIHDRQRHERTYHGGSRQL